MLARLGCTAYGRCCQCIKQGVERGGILVHWYALCGGGWRVCEVPFWPMRAISGCPRLFTGHPPPPPPPPIPYCALLCLTSYSNANANRAWLQCTTQQCFLGLRSLGTRRYIDKWWVTGSGIRAMSEGSSAPPPPPPPPDVSLLLCPHITWFLGRLYY